MIKPGLSWHYGKIISGLSTMRVFDFEMLPFHKLLVFYVCREHILGVINLPSWVGCGSPATIVLLFGACLLLLLQSFVAKQACLVLWLSKPAFLNNH